MTGWRTRQLGYMITAEHDPHWMETYWPTGAWWLPSIRAAMQWVNRDVVDRILDRYGSLGGPVFWAVCMVQQNRLWEETR